MPDTSTSSNDNTSAGRWVRVGVGAGFSDDRVDPAHTLVTGVPLDYLVFECLAERTIARETLTRTKHPERGYSPSLPDRIEAVLGECLARGTKIVTNMGAAHPESGTRLVREIGRNLGLGLVRTAAILGDEVSGLVRAHPELQLIEGDPLESILPRMVSANAYLGADIVRQALTTGADVVVGGRIADPSLFLGCLMHAHGWAEDDLKGLAAGTLTGHLLECGTQLTGGCFADPGVKDVPAMARVGLPFASVSADGAVRLGKTPNMGGLLSVATCTEQILYEMHDPAAYITPDCVLDITQVRFEQLAIDIVAFTGAQAKPRTDTLKVVVGYSDGWIGEGEVGYAGPHALERARLAEAIVKERLRMRGLHYEEMRVDYIGATSLHGPTSREGQPYEVRLRIAARSPDRKTADAVGFEMRTLHVNGPAGGGGGTHNTREVLAVKSLLMPRSLVEPQLRVEVSA